MLSGKADGKEAVGSLGSGWYTGTCTSGGTAGKSNEVGAGFGEEAVLTVEGTTDPNAGPWEISLFSSTSRGAASGGGAMDVPNRPMSENDQSNKQEASGVNYAELYP